MTKKRKLNVAILFGGRSAEHEVSLRSAKNVFDAIDKTKFNPILIGIDKNGQWLMGDSSRYLLESGNKSEISIDSSGDSVALIPQQKSEIVNFTHPENTHQIDVVFPILHGPYGEDGTVQGLLKLADIPFVGASVLGSAVGMDKDVMKRLLRDANIPIANFIVIKKENQAKFDDITKHLGLPLIVKPANLGSSVGVSKVRNKKAFEDAIALAFQFDTKVMIEECIQGREIECSVLGNDNPIASVPGEVIVKSDFYSYEAKYLHSDDAILEIPAKVDEETKKRIQDLAVKTFQVLCCEGLGRVDFFLKENGEVLVNEINTLPGFTSISMYPKLWEASGMSYASLIEKLIELAIERFEKEKLLKVSR